ncbi:MAG: tetratricopeptide repeat protein [Bryobacteraceae bacterium]|nr:tetratricopeptide repeat protein [Bryobacteraceae bacterium]
MADPAISTPPGDEVRQALDRIVASPRFCGSEKLCRFLRFIIETTLDGRADEIKEMLVAIEVYGRGTSYDPQSDSIVRVEASRLRSKLREYYQEEGKDEPVRISLPRGGYIPVFERGPILEKEPPASPAAELAVPRRSRRRWIWALVAVVPVAAIGWFGTALIRGKKQTIDAIAVLPFVNLSSGEGDERFTDGMTEDITTELARLPKLSVPGRTTMSQYKGKAVDIAQVGRLTNVDAVLEGSVRHEGNRFLVTAQLINVADGYHLWADTYERRSRDNFSVQRELSGTLAKAIGDRTSGHTPWHGATRTPLPREAIEAYSQARELLSRDFMLRRNEGALPPELRHGIESLEEAIRISPDFARAWSGLAGAFQRSIDLEPRGPNTEEMKARAEHAARRAIALDPTLAEAHAALGTLLFYRDWDWDGAERELRRAIELDPRQPMPPREYSDLLRLRGRADEALAEILRVETLVPRSDALPTQKAVLFYSAGRFDEAMAEAAKALAARSDSREAHWVVGICLEAQGKLAEAETRFHQILAMSPKDGRALPALGHVLGVQGRRGEALRIAADMIALSEKGGGMEYPLALVYAGMGDSAQTFRWLEAALDRRDPSVMYLRVDPRLKHLQKDARFQALSTRLRL